MHEADKEPTERELLQYDQLNLKFYFFVSRDMTYVLLTSLCRVALKLRYLTFRVLPQSTALELAL